MKAIRLLADLLDKKCGEKSDTSRSESASKHWHNPHVEIAEVPRPALRGHELLLKISYCGVCGSDFHLASAGPSGNMLYPGLLQLPVTIGHEFSGVVESSGCCLSDRERALFKPGTPVTAEEMLWCGRCEQCRAGNPNHCSCLEEIGFTTDGAHAEYIAIDAKYCWSLEPLAEKFGLEKALQYGAMVEPYAVSYRALFQGSHKGSWQPGQRVLVIGAGPIGLAAVDLAQAAGAVQIAVIEPVAERRDTAKKLGADICWDLEDLSSLQKKCADFTQNFGFDWIVDAAGATTMAGALVRSSLAIGGSIALLARTDEAGIIDSEALITKNAKIYGSQGHSGESAFPRVIQLMAKEKIRPGALIKAVVNMQEAAERLQRQEKCAGKILVDPRLTF